MAASKNAFIEVCRFRGAGSAVHHVQCGDPLVTVEGIAESFADNVPNQGTIEIVRLAT